MAGQNFFTVVNFSGEDITAKVNALSIPVEAGAMSTGNKFQSGDGDLPITIEGNSLTLKNIPGGDNSWSTLVYTSVNVVNVFPSGANQGVV